MLKHRVIEGIMELVQDLDSISKQIADQAVDHIRSNDTVLTIGRSKTVGAFLTAAKRKKRTFHVIVRWVALSGFMSGRGVKDREDWGAECQKLFVGAAGTICD